MKIVSDFDSNELLGIVLDMRLTAINSSWRLELAEQILIQPISNIHAGVEFTKDKCGNLLPAFLVSDNKILSMVLTHLSEISSSSEALEVMSILSVRQPYLFREKV
jgi:hypothetical protein